MKAGGTDRKCTKFPTPNVRDSNSVLKYMRSLHDSMNICGIFSKRTTFAFTQQIMATSNCRQIKSTFSGIPSKRKATKTLVEDDRKQLTST